MLIQQDKVYYKVALKTLLKQLKGATSQFLHLEKFSLHYSSWSFAIHVNLRHPYPSSFLFGLFLPLWHLTKLANDYFKVLFYLKAILHDAKNDSKYCDVAPLRGCLSQILMWLDKVLHSIWSD